MRSNSSTAGIWIFQIRSSNVLTTELASSPSSCIICQSGSAQLSQVECKNWIKSYKKHTCSTRYINRRQVWHFPTGDGPNNDVIHAALTPYITSREKTTTRDFHTVASFPNVMWTTVKTHPFKGTLYTIYIDMCEKKSCLLCKRVCACTSRAI